MVAMVRCSSRRRLRGQKKRGRESCQPAHNIKPFTGPTDILSSKVPATEAWQGRTVRLCAGPQVLHSIRLCLLELIPASPSHFL